MGERQQSSIRELISQARERLGQQLRAHSEQFQKLEQGLRELQNRHQQLEGTVEEQLEILSKVQPSSSSPSTTSASEPPMENVLAAVRNLITATLPEQVHDVLTEEAEQMGVRAAVFDVRGKSAWGRSARGFGPDLSAMVFRTLAVPLNQDNPFRHVYETGGPADSTSEFLKKNKNVLDKLKPAGGDPILLLPIRSAGAVSAIFYADPGGKKRELPVNALKILTEFAGAQLDRLMALSGGLSSPEEHVGAPQVELVSASHENKDPTVQASSSDFEVETPHPSSAIVEERSGAPASPASGFDLSQLDEAEQKVHKDARRFARLLISEIELYNKAKVADGRKNKDLYRRLKADIDRSRQTYEKRFGKTVAKQHNYFHEELVKTLASSDPSMLGADYPDPSA